MALSDQSQVWFPTHVQVTVIQSRGLRIKGKQGLNDAYTLIQLGKEKYSTSVAEKTLCPRWQEDCTFEVPADASSAKKSTLVLTVMHRALVGGDKFLGQVTLPLRDIYQDSTRKKTQWYKLESKPGKKEKERGELEVNIQYMRNNLTASMFDLSLKDKKRTPFGKLRDKVSGKKKEGSKGGESSSAVVSSSAAMDSDEEGHAPDVEQKKKKTKTLSLFSKSSMQKGSVSQSMLTLPTSKGLGSLASLSPFRHHGRRESSGTASVNSDSDSVGGSNPNLADSPDGSPGASKSDAEPHPGLSTSPLASTEVQSTHRRHVSLTGIEEEEGNREGLPGKSKKSTSSGGSNPFGSDDLGDANPFANKKGADDPAHKNPFQEKSPPSGSASSAPAKKSEEKKSHSSGFSLPSLTKSSSKPPKVPEQSKHADAEQPKKESGKKLKLPFFSTPDSKAESAPESLPAATKHPAEEVATRESPRPSVAVNPFTMEGNDTETVTKPGTPHPIKPMRIRAVELPSNSSPVAAPRETRNQGKRPAPAVPGGLRMNDKDLATEMRESQGGQDEGPYAHLTRAELVQLLTRQQAELVDREQRIHAMEDYIDNLLVRVIEETPAILRQPERGAGRKAGRVW
ncbi:rab11 family-interacting protein 1-like isoform X2 [Lethenteron reissneri]|uniref:rab11 family-interacting protein 1-like isoform X2 n=1 Tax=Lethenteron reissneri TaxID=7753 RepID=UPI002AB6AF94|nr:rab11 family-interacting protein 1-like isoform X2 [Lethenteron reissneri]